MLENEEIMMSFLKRFFKRTEKVFQARIVLLGPSKAGKTTLVKYLETGSPVTEEVRTTLGIDLRDKSFKLDKWEFSAIDVGGQQVYQKTFWNLGVQQSNAVIWMIDGLVRPEHPGFPDAIKQFKYGLNLIDENVPLLVLVNKQDLEEQKPLTIEEAGELYEFSSLIGRSIILLPSSAKYGNGVDTAMQWLVEKLNDTMET